MKLKDAKKELARLIIRSGTTAALLTPAEAIRIMLNFYRQIPVDDVPLEECGGDMLLYQWGTHDWGHGSFFRCNITRQFIVADTGGDEGFTQLSLTCLFPPSPAFDALKSGNRWCRSVDDLVAFEAFISSSGAYRAVATSKPHKIAIECGGV